MGLNIDDYQNEQTWISAVRDIQVSEQGAVKTSASAPGRPQPKGLTTYTVSGVLQGQTTYKPKASTLDLFNQTLSKDFEGLRTEKYFVEDKALSPYDVFVGVPSENPDIFETGIGMGTTPAAPTPTAGEPPGQTYFMGDSLTVGLQMGDLSGKLAAKGYSPSKINADGGRSIGGPGMQIRQSGFDAITADTAFIRDSKHVMIALGTNLENNFDANLAQIMNQVRAIAPNAKLWWVDVGASGINHQSAAATNRAIYARSGQDPNYTVISQFKFLWGEDKDPQTYDISGGDPAGLLSGDGVHYGGAGSYGKYAEYIVSKLPAAPPPSSGTPVTGGDNKTIIWNFFVGKGTPPHQIAGIMGNMQAESGFEPRRVQYGTPNSKGQTSVAGQPSSLDDQPGPVGYGLVQWTPGTKILPDANAQGRPPGDIMFQLDHLYMILTTGNESPAGRIIFATATVEDAARQFMLKFERPRDQSPSAQTPRINFAKAILDEFT